MSVAIDTHKTATASAKKCQMRGLQLISLRHLGFWQGNRGGLGIVADYVHDIARRCILEDDGTELDRYQFVDVVRVPVVQLESVQAANMDMASRNPKMPQCNAEYIQYVTMNNTHFVHAMKLFCDGGRTVHNLGETNIEYQEGDIEGPLIKQDGIMCRIYSEELYSDWEAMEALCVQGNANTDLGGYATLEKNEMQAFGRVCSLYDQIEEDARSVKQRHRDLLPWFLKDFTSIVTLPVVEPTVEYVLETIRNDGAQHFNDDEWLCFIKLRHVLPRGMAVLLQSLVFQFCPTRVRVRPSDFQVVAYFDDQCPFIKVAILVCQYIRGFQ